MNSEAVEPDYPLAVDRRGTRFRPHPDATHFALVRCTVSSSYTMRRGAEPLTLPLDATIEDACSAVDDQPGLYRLPQCDRNGHHLDAPAAYFEIQAYGSAGRGHEIDEWVAFDLLERLFEAEQHKSRIFTQFIQFMLRTQVELQANTVTLIESANRIIHQVNGIKSREREQRIDLDQLVERILDAKNEREPTEPAPPTWVELLTSPLGSHLAAILKRVFPRFGPDQPPEE